MNNNENEIPVNLPSGEEGKNVKKTTERTKVSGYEEIDPRKVPITPDDVGKVVLVCGEGFRQILHTFNGDNLLPINGIWSVNGESHSGSKNKVDVDFYYRVDGACND